MIVLDTNILIDIEKQNQGTIQALEQIVIQNPNHPASITWVNYYEFSIGTEKKLLDEFDFLPMDIDSTKVFLKLKRQKLGVNDFDLLIASVVIANDGILVTRDRDFERINGLKLKII